MQFLKSVKKPNKALNTCSTACHTGTVTQRRFAIMPLRHCPLAQRYVLVRNLMHCCDEMNRHVVIASKEGVDPYDSSDQVIVYSDKFDEYGLIIRDGGTSSYEITFCPFCGSKLPESKRDRWFEELEKLGHENPFDDESIPNAYKSSDWFRRT